MCIRDRPEPHRERLPQRVRDALQEPREELQPVGARPAHADGLGQGCLLYTSDAADERSSVDLGGRRIIKKKKQNRHNREQIRKD